jgi:apolipoprotein D and lipocalin family protein
LDKGYFVRYFLFIGLCCGLLGCLGAPEGIEAVKGFDSNRYLGKWYEVARLDHSFERGLSAVTAEYSMREDGGIRVINSGLSAESGTREEAEGRAYFMGKETEGYLKVSFFGPFFGSYIVFELDREDYQYAFVAGNSTQYLWLLSRSPTVSDDLKARFIAQSAALGFDTHALLFD